MSSKEVIIKEIRDLQKKIDELEQIGRYEPIDYNLLEKYENKQKELLLKVEEVKNNDYEEIIVNEGWCVPLPSKNNIISNKKMDYKTLGLITLISNRKTEYIEGIDFTEEEEHRYIYEQGENSILSNADYIESISNNKLITIKRNLKKLADCDNDVVSYCEDEHGKYYKIMPYTLGDNGKLQYVTIDNRILEYLCNVYNSNAIKIYCVLLWVLWDNKNKCYIEKMLTYDWLLKQIGLSNGNSGKNSKMLNDILFTFEKVGLIKRRKETITEERKGYNTIVKTVYYYSLGSTEDFLKSKKR